MKKKRRNLSNLPEGFGQTVSYGLIESGSSPGERTDIDQSDGDDIYYENCLDIYSPKGDNLIQGRKE